MPAPSRSRRRPRNSPTSPSTSADTQREVISSVETMLKSAAYIRASGRRRTKLRNPARQPADQFALDPQPSCSSAKDGLVQCATMNILVGLHLGDREYFRKAQASGDFVFSDYLFGKIQQPADHDGRLSCIRDQSGGRCRRRRRHQYRLDVEDHEQSRRAAGHFGVAGRQFRHRDGRTRRSVQHDRPVAGQRAADGGHRRQGPEFRNADRIAFIHRARTARNAP